MTLRSELEKLVEQLKRDGTYYDPYAPDNEKVDGKREAYLEMADELSAILGEIERASMTDRTNRVLAKDIESALDAAKRDTWIEALEWALHNPETIRIVDTLVKLRAEKEKGR